MENPGKYGILWSSKIMWKILTMNICCTAICFWNIRIWWHLGLPRGFLSNCYQHYMMPSLDAISVLSHPSLSSHTHPCPLTPIPLSGIGAVHCSGVCPHTWPEGYLGFVCLLTRGSNFRHHCWWYVCIGARVPPQVADKESWIYETNCQFPNWPT